MRKAQQTGVGIVAVSRCGHIGRVGHYPLSRGPAGAGDGPVRQHAWRRQAGRALGWTRAAAVGQPDFGWHSAPGPTSRSCWTWPHSSIAEGKLMDMLNRGVAAPPGCIVDAEGRPTTDPVAYFGPPAGALLPFGGHKGFGLLLCHRHSGRRALGRRLQPRRRDPGRQRIPRLCDPARSTPRRRCLLYRCGWAGATRQEFGTGGGLR